MPERFEAALFADPRRPRIAARVLLVAAHPDDETVGAGAQLHRCDDLLLLHLTDGAPRNLVDARRHGFEDWPSYAAARARELQAALTAGSVSAARLSWGLPDQGLARRLCELCSRMSAFVEWLRPDALITHAYEGGHPDHDAAALACQVACGALPPDRRPRRIEFAGYHAAAGGPSWGRFVTEDASALTISLTKEEQRRKAAMLACFTTQTAVLADAPRTQERLRPTPEHDFRHPPHPGPLWYERMSWGVTGAEWRSFAAEALEKLPSGPSC
jgi:LmbE family N-acetylglucosaminyl deacetylase